MRLFLGGRCYTAEKLEKDYLAEVANYSNDRWEAPQRASRLAASVKRYKTSEMLRFIFATIAYDPDPDLTPLTVRPISRWFDTPPSKVLWLCVHYAKARPQHFYYGDPLGEMRLVSRVFEM
uniref:YadA protein n=1 Tax=Escherichia coli TaxID=562 RepID=A0A0C5AXL4_ECOLX|nr:YadA protein [Escherichia coli]